MTTSSNSSENKTIVAFHTGRGGRYNNAGHITFIGTNDINYFTDDLFSNYENAHEILEKIKGRENLENLYNEVVCDDSDEAIKFFSKLSLDFGKKVYADCSGNYVGLDVDNDGTGTIDIDNDYDRKSCFLLSECGENDLKIILESGEWNKTDVIVEFFNECTDLVIDWSKFNGDYKDLIHNYFTCSEIDVTEYYNEEIED